LPFTFNPPLAFHIFLPPPKFKPNTSFGGGGECELDQESFCFKLKMGASSYKYNKLVLIIFGF